MDDEREGVLFTVSGEVAQAAVAQVASCEACNPHAAEFPFECILDREDTSRVGLQPANPYLTERLYRARAALQESNSKN